MSETKTYKYLIGFVSEQFVPVAAGAKIGQMKETICSEVIDLPFRIQNEEDLINTQRYMIEKGFDVRNIVSFSHLISTVE